MRGRSLQVVALTGVLGLLAAGCGTPTPGSDGPTVDASAGARLELRIVAKDVAFEPAELGAPRGMPLHLVLDNRDVDIPHNIVLLGANGSTKLAETEIVTGGSAEVDVPGLVPGAYQLTCAVHPNMVSALTVE